MMQIVVKMKSEVVIPDDMRTRLPAPAAHLPKHKYVWMTNEEVASILINFLKHNDWITTSRVYRPESGCLLMFNRKKVKYRQDLYIWKTKRKSKWCREDHVKLKVGGTPCITALYVHSDILPTFHRRCYWFIQNPDIVLVHYLNYPYKDSGKQIIRDLSLNHQCQQWQHLSKQELIDQLHPMFTGIPWPSITSSPLDPESMDIIVDSLIENHYFEQRHRVLPLQNGLTQRIMKPRVIMANGNIEFTQNCSHVSLSSNSTTSNVKMNQSATPIFCNNASLILVNDATIRRASNSTELFLPGSVIPMIKPTHSDDSSMGNQLPGIKKNDIEGTKGRPNLRLMENHISIKPLCANVLSAQQLKVSEHDTTKSAQPLNEKLTNDMDIQTENKECNVNTPPILADYGVKDVMVPNCQSSVVQPKQSPFVESLKSSSVPDGGFDVFDVDSLFTTSTSKNSDQSASIDADQNNSSNESAVSDLFPQQLWEPVLDESSSMQSYSDMATNNLLETFGPITEYSPDWSYTEGGVKVLITGSWSFCGNFTCTFGNLLVPATNVQNGVLRCYAPAHKAGQVDLTVVCNGIIASRPVPFQYKEITPAHTELASEWLKLNEDQFKLSIISRLEKMEERLNSMGTSAGLNNQHGGAQYTLREATNHLGSGEEARLVNLLKNLYGRYLMIGRSCAIDFGHEGTQGMSLLHCAAALGYLDLIHTLHSFGKSEVDWTPYVNGECSPGNVDKFGCSPLYWACARGHINCAEFLLGWDAAQLHIVDFLGRSPTGIASLHGHHQLFKRLESLTTLSKHEEDLLDTSSNGDTATTETLDSGEDSMDDPSSPAENSPPPLFPTDGAETRQVDHPMCCGSYFRPKDENMTLIAEQILESTSNTNKASEDLSLRSLPKFVTSRCGSVKNNQPLQRDAESVMNWSEFLQLPPNSRVNENHLNSLRLTDQEHRQLNFAAKTVLLAYNKDRLTFSGHELRASLLIQHCYRKFHMFATCKKMNEAAVLIQSKFRSYQEQKRFQRSRHAAILIQSFYRSYKHTRTFEKCTDQPSSVQLIEEALRCHLTKRKQHQAARKIQRFLRRCHYRQHEGDHISPHERFTC